MSIAPVQKYEKRGRPNPSEIGEIVGYQIQAKAIVDTVKVGQLLYRKGRFILPTNDLDTERFSDDKILRVYLRKRSILDNLTTIAAG
jgi:hypothetical protein